MASSDSTTAAASRSERERKLEMLQEQNRKLQSQLEVQTGKNKELQATLYEASVANEVEEEHITNALLRRLEALRKHKEVLGAQLAQEEHRKMEQEALLMRLKKSRTSLERHLRQEEVEIREKLERQLSHAQKQRLDMQEKVQAESSTLQQLHECIRSLRESAVSPSISPAKGPTTMPSLTMPTLHGSTDVNFSVNGSCSSEGGMKHGVVGEVATSERDAVSSVCRSPNASCSVGAQDASTPVGASTCVSDGQDTPLSSKRSFAGDSDMLRLLESEIHVAEALRRDAEGRASEYSRRVGELQQQISEAESDRESQRLSADLMRAELMRTTNVVHELSANQEVVAEWALDRELLGTHHGHMRSSSVCSTISSHTAETPSTMVSDVPEGFTPRVLHAARHA